MIRLGVIGLGGRMSAMVRGMCRRCEELNVVAVADPDEAGARQRLSRREIRVEGVKLYRSADEMLQFADRYDGIAIGTRCHLHTPLAVKVAKTGLPLFLEKPVAISWEQLGQLQQAFSGRESSVLVSFPLRVTPLFRKSLEIVESGRLGTVNQIQAINNVNYGGVYFGQWHRNYHEAAGLWLQKATHDFDYLNLLARSTPVAVAAMATRRIYGGDMPHDLTCSTCDRTAACPESTVNQQARRDGGGMHIDDHGCPYSREIRNQDAGSALIRYADDTLVNYSQNFVARRWAGRRGATITGHLGTLEFDWRSNRVHVIEHHRNIVETMDGGADSEHFGGDDVLERNFIDMLRGNATPVADLKAGLLSVAMCLAAKRSAYTQSFQPIHLPGETATGLRPVAGVEPCDTLSA